MGLQGAPIPVQTGDPAVLPGQAVGAPEAVRPLHPNPPTKKGPVDLPIEPQVPHPQGSQGLPVVGSPQVGETGSPEGSRVAVGVEAHLQGRLHGAGSVVGVEDPGKPREGGEALPQLDGGIVGAPREQTVVQPLRLSGQGLHQPRVPVTEEVHPPGGDAVQDPTARLVLQPDPPGGSHRQGGPLLVVRHLGAGVPVVGPDPASAAP